MCCYSIIRAHSLLSPNSVPLYVCTTVCLFTAKENLCYFQFRVMMRKAALSILTQALCGYTFLYHLGKYLGLWLLDRRVRLFLLLKATATSPSTWAVAFWVPISRAWECVLFCLMPVSLLDLSNSNRRQVASYFHWCFPNHVWFCSSLPMLICHLYIVFDEVLVQIFCLPFKLVFFFSVIFKCSLCVLDSGPLSHMWFANILSQADLSFSCPKTVFFRRKCFNFNGVQFISFINFLAPCF